MKPEHVYIHFPFCISKCPYCDFFSMIYDGQHQEKKYISHLSKESDLFKDILTNLKSLYIGGGTPSLMRGNSLKAVLEKFTFDPDAELTIEANPGTVDLTKLKYLKDSGVNRLSIGAQSFIDSELVTLKRRHSARDIYDAFYNARRAGFQNINIDLMIGVPGQSSDSVIYSLKKIFMLMPEHISVYILTYYKNSAFGRMLKKDQIRKMDDDMEIDLFEMICNMLEEKGYERYEISNFSRPGMYSVHNLNTWDYGQYIGLGASAHSFVGGIRRANPKSLEKYYRYVEKAFPHIEGKNIIYSRLHKQEFLMVGLRKTSGISMKRYKNIFNSDIMDDFRTGIETFLENGFLVRSDDILRIRKDKLNIINSILAEII
ncbi:MAG: radical SAM family heme chaperone HemW [Candidatus Delongbacteria bacterium]